MKNKGRNAKTIQKSAVVFVEDFCYASHTSFRRSRKAEGLQRKRRCGGEKKRAPPTPRKLKKKRKRERKDTREKTLW